MKNINLYKNFDDLMAYYLDEDDKVHLTKVEVLEGAKAVVIDGQKFLMENGKISERLEKD